MPWSTFTRRSDRSSQQHGAKKGSIQVGLRVISNLLKRVDSVTHEKIEQLHRRLSPPGTATRSTKEATTKAQQVDPAQLLANLRLLDREDHGDTGPQNGSAAVLERPSAGTTKSCGTQARATKSKIEDHNPSMTVSYPAAQKLCGRNVSIVDTSACTVPRRHCQQSLHGGLRRNNAIRRRRAPDRLRNGINRAKLLERFRDEIQWTNGSVGVELLPPHPDIRAMLRRSPPALPSELAQRPDMVHPMKLYATGVLISDERSACRALPTLEEAPLDTDLHNLREEFGSRSTDDHSLQLLRGMLVSRRSTLSPLGNCNCPAPTPASLDSINSTSVPDEHAVRVVEVRSHAVELRRSASVRSQAGIVVSGNDVPNYDILDNSESTPLLSTQ